MFSHFFSPRSYFAAKQVNEAKAAEAKAANTTTNESSFLIDDREIEASQHEITKTTTSQSEDSTPDDAQTMSEEDYDAKIASLNKRLSQLRKKLESPSYGTKQNSTTPPPQKYSYPKFAPKYTHTVTGAVFSSSKSVTDVHDIWYGAMDEFNAKLREKKKLENQRYGRFGLQLQLFAEWALTPKQRERYRQKLARVNEVRRAEGKSLK